jgi:membrane protease YdiL (CAAX protease family)
VLDSLGLRLRGRDIAVGFATWFVTLIAMAIVRALLVTAGVPFTSNVGGGGERVGRDRSIFLISSLIAVVVAPFVEELVFRGVVLRSLRSRLNVPASLLIQGILFGCAHADVSFGAGNIGLLSVLSLAGVSLGLVAVKFRRNGPNMMAHAFMNGFVFLLLYGQRS